MVLPTRLVATRVGFVSAPLIVRSRGLSISRHDVSTSPLTCTSFIPRLHTLLPSRAIVRNPTVNTFTTRAVLGGGGFLGVGPAEIVVIVAVGWLLLGPEKLYNLAKDSGKLIGQLRRAASEAQDTFTDALDAELDSKEDKNRSHTDDKSDSRALKAKDTDYNENENDQLSDTLNSRVSSQAEVNGEESVNSDLDSLNSQPNGQFLDQLRRVSDPAQAPPSDVPDLDVSIEMEEHELKQLEKQYLQARARLEARKNTNSTDGENSPTQTSDKTEQYSGQSDATPKNT